MWQTCGPHGTGELGMAISGWTYQGSESDFAKEGRKAAAMCSNWTGTLLEEEEDDDKYSVISQAFKLQYITNRGQNSARPLDQILICCWDSRDSPAALESRISPAWAMISWEHASKLFQGQCMDKVQLFKRLEWFSRVTKSGNLWGREGKCPVFQSNTGQQFALCSLQEGDQPALRHKE